MQRASMYSQVGARPVVGSRPVPVPVDGQLLVKVLACAVNPADHKVIDWPILIFDPTVGGPHVVGSDIAGLVVAAGPGTRFKPGDKVFYQGNYIASPNETGFQEYSLAWDQTTSNIPANLTYAAASTVTAAAIAAFVSIFHPTGLGLPPPAGIDYSHPDPIPTPDTILVLGGSSNLGQYALQFLRMAGVKNILTTAASKYTSLLRAKGATEVFDRHDPELTSRIKSVWGTKIRHVVDLVSSRETILLGQQVSSDSEAVTHTIVLFTPKDMTGFPKKAEGSAIKEIWGSTFGIPELGPAFVRALEGWLGSEELVTGRPVVVGGLEKVPEALDIVRSGEMGDGKAVIAPWGVEALHRVDGV